MEPFCTLEGNDCACLPYGDLSNCNLVYCEYGKIALV